MSMKNGECDGCTDVGIENCIACIERGGGGAQAPAMEHRGYSEAPPEAGVGWQGQTYDDYVEGGK